MRPNHKQGIEQVPPELLAKMLMGGPQQQRQLTDAEKTHILQKMKLKNMLDISLHIYEGVVRDLLTQQTDPRDIGTEMYQRIAEASDTAAMEYMKAHEEDINLLAKDMFGPPQSPLV